jgi:hypothetical protein
MTCDCSLLVFLYPCISLFKLYFYTKLIGCLCFYKADTMVRVVREYPNPKFRAPEFSSIVKHVVISGIDSCRRFEPGGPWADE